MLLNQLSRALYEIRSTQKTNLFIYIYFFFTKVYKSNQAIITNCHHHCLHHDSHHYHHHRHHQQQHNNNNIILFDITIRRIYLPLLVYFRDIFGYFHCKELSLSPNTLFNGRSGGDKASFFRRMKLCLDRQLF